MLTSSFGVAALVTDGSEDDEGDEGMRPLRFGLGAREFERDVGVEPLRGEDDIDALQSENEASEPRNMNASRDVCNGVSDSDKGNSPTPRLWCDFSYMPCNGGVSLKLCLTCALAARTNHEEARGKRGAFGALSAHKA